MKPTSDAEIMDVKRIQQNQIVFISSTAYDLVDLRAEVMYALKEWGFIAFGHELPFFPVSPGLHSHDVCLEAVSRCDTLLLVIGGRYGGIYTGSNISYREKEWSVTRCEADMALNEGKHIVVFVRDNVWNERNVYNKFVASGKRPDEYICAFVDNTEIFEFLNDIQRKKNDNWITPFKDSVQLKNYLRGRLTGEAKDIFSAEYFGKFE